MIEANEFYLGKYIKFKLVHIGELYANECQFILFNMHSGFINLQYGQREQIVVGRLKGHFGR